MSWAEFLQLDWAHPLWGLLALQPLLIWLLLKLRRDQVRHYADAHLLPWVLRDAVDRKQERVQILRNIATWLLLATAMAGPRLPLPGDATQQARPQHTLDIMVLLDVSPSMYAADVAPQRLQRAKLELQDLLQRLNGERLGLIAFSGSAGMIMPLNRDEAAFLHFLQVADPGLFEAKGTALASALELAQRKFTEAGSTHHAILLLSDAETSALSGPAGEAAWEMADKLKQAAMPVYILGVGSEQGATVTLPDGGQLVSEGEDVISRMDADGFADLARKTGGKFVRVADRDGDWQALYDNGLLNQPGGKSALENIHAWRELFGWLLFPAFLLLLWPYLEIFNKLKLSKLGFAALLLGMSMPQQSHAGEMEAYAAYQAKQLALAQALYAQVPGYAGRMGEGTAAYRRQDYLYAVKQYTTALLQAYDQQQREQALFNLGNSYFMAGNYRAAAESFYGVLKYRDNNADARANLALAAGKMQQQPRNQGGNNGLLGRRGRQTGGKLGENAEDQPLSIEDKQKESTPGFGSEMADANKAKLKFNEQAKAATLTGEDPEAVYRVALKKLELENDQPLALHKLLIRMEAQRNYVPLQELPPW